MGVSAGELLEELERLADEFGKPPTIRELDARGEYPRSAYLREFGSWNAALEAAGLPPNQRSGLSKDDLTTELQRLGEELGEAPTATDMREQGVYSRQAYVTKFGSWNAALETAGFEPRPSTTRVSTDELIEALQELTEDLARTPTQQDVREHGPHAVSTYLSRFESWDAVLEAAGLPAPDSATRISEEALLEELQRVAEEVERPPTSADIDEHGEYAAGTYGRRFGSITAAREAAGLPTQVEPEETGSTHEVGTQELIRDLERLARELGHPPSLKEYRKHGEHSHTTYYERFGSWPEALEAAGLESRDPETEIPDAELLAELHRLAAEHNQRPSARLMNKAGAYWDSTYKDHFGSWTNALEAAGFRVENTTGGPIDREALLAEIRRLTEELGHEPTLSELEDVGRYSPSTYYRRFGSWSAALAEAHSTDES